MRFELVNEGLGTTRVINLSRSELAELVCAVYILFSLDGAYDDEDIERAMNVIAEALEHEDTPNSMRVTTLQFPMTA